MDNKSVVKLSAHLQVILDNMELGFDFRDFYLCIFGFYLFQGAAWILAYYAQQHSKYLPFLLFKLFLLSDVLTDVVVRSFFIVVQIILLLIFETRMHLFQWK